MHGGRLFDDQPSRPRVTQWRKMAGGRVGSGLRDYPYIAPSQTRRWPPRVMRLGARPPEDLKASLARLNLRN